MTRNATFTLILNSLLLLGLPCQIQAGGSWEVHIPATQPSVMPIYDFLKTIRSAFAGYSEQRMAIEERQEWMKRMAKVIAETKPKFSENTEEYVHACVECTSYLSSCNMGEGRFSLCQRIAAGCLPYVDAIPVELAMQVVEQMSYSLDLDGRPLTEKAFSVYRNTFVDYRLRVWRRIQAGIDPTWRADDPANLVTTPTPKGGEYLRGGISPEDIQDPEIRAEYEKRLAENHRKADRNYQQFRARQNSDIWWKHLQPDIVSTYKDRPATDEDWEMLKACLRVYVAQPELRQELFDNCQAAAGDAVQPKPNAPDGLRPQGPAEAPAAPKALTLNLGNRVTMKLVLIPSGTFIMGSPKTEKDWHEDEGPQHEVTISRPFWMGTCHVTRGQFAAFVTDSRYKTQAEKEGWSHVWDKTQWGKAKGMSWRNPGFDQTDDHPVVCVDHDDAIAFCNWLTRKSGRKVGLPTEAQWEYACRAGTTTPFFTGQTINADLANYNANWVYGFGRKGVYRQKTSPAGVLKANAWGLYDMAGNAWQWCADWYDEKYYSHSPKTDPLGPASGQYRILRGGSWEDDPGACRSAIRDWKEPVLRLNGTGFRVVVQAE